MKLDQSLRIACVGFCVIALVGCKSDPQAEAYPEAVFSEEQTLYWRVGDVEEQRRIVSMGAPGGYFRVSQRMVVPLGRTKPELIATLDRAARTLTEETGADAVMMPAYRPQDHPSGSYTVGRVVYAPNGYWESAGSNAAMRMSIDLNDLYFESSIGGAEDPTSYSLASAIQALDYLDASRAMRKIFVPTGRSNSELEATLQRAARELAAESRANAVKVLAYRPRDDPSGSQTVGEAIYAPNGRWEDAGSSGPRRMSLKLNDLYFSSEK